MTKINLKRANTSIFELHTDFQMDKEDFNQLFGEYSKEFEDESYILFAKLYSSQKTKHVMVVALAELDEQTYHLHILYRIDPDAPTPPKTLWKPERAFELLRPIAGSCEFDIYSTFSYPANRVASTMRIPIRLASDSTSDFDVIHGMRLVRLTQDDKVKFIIVIDHQGDSIRHNLNFTYEGRVTADTIVDAFNAGVDISESFIKRTLTSNELNT